VAAAAQIACLLDVMVAKPGNVSRGRDLPGLSYRDLVLSATSIGPAFRKSGTLRVGTLILEAIRRTRRHVRTNTNLGIVLLLAPLARAALRRGSGTLRDRTRRVLAGLDRRDARDAYRAIRLARPGGLGRVEHQDVSRTPSLPLLECMRLAAGRDAVAREYDTGFRTTFTSTLPRLRNLRARHLPLPHAIVQTFLSILAATPDTLIARRHGAPAARKVSLRAGAALRAGGVLTERGRGRIDRLDHLLRSADPPLNPGATADLMVAALFVDLLEGAGSDRRASPVRAGSPGRSRSRRRG
jgi:triphosphoribosyl-dephospho-CoA synthase